MATLRITENIKEVERQLDALAREQVPFALARSLTKIAQEVRVRERAEIDRSFDRPTPYTRNSLFVRPATKQSLSSEVWLKDGNRPSHYLLPQIRGGTRPLRRFEERLVRVGIMQPDERAVPGLGAELDRYGNVSLGQIVKILSQLKTAAVLGDTSNATDSRRSKAKRSTVSYFVSRGPGTWTGLGSWKNGEKSQHLPRGIWSKRRFALGTAIRPVFLFVPRAQYSVRFKFYEIAEQVIADRFSAVFAESLSGALKTARPRAGGTR